MTTALRSNEVTEDVMIHLHTLGQCLISIGTTRLAPNARMLFASALFVAVEGRRKVERSKFTEILWPELPDSNGTHAMRQMCYRLRSCGMPLEASGARITLPDGTVFTDFDDLLDESSPVSTDELLTRIPGGFLPGYMPRVSEPFTHWVEEQRAHVNSALRRRLGAAITERRAAGDWQATEKLAMRCLELDPLNELATLAYAESIAMDGSKARAIAVLDRYSSEIGPASKQIREPMLALRQRIIELYPVPPVIEVEPPQIGREEEMAKLDAALKDAREGRGSAFVISGPPGIGKTRLVTEFTRAAELKGTKIARTSMGRHDDHRPLGAWSDLVPPLRRMPGAVGIDPDSIPYLQRLTSYDSSQATPSAESQDAEYLFARIRLSIVDLVAAVASESCVILLIEDIHWMDEWSWDVTAALSKKLSTTGVLVLMTRRDTEEGSTPIPKDAAIIPMPLQPLSAAFCRKLFGHVGPAKRSSEEDFIDWCVRTSAGNPYFLIELGRRASKSDGRFQAPPSLTKLVAERFLDVTPLSRRVIQAAAILGSHSTLPRIESVLDERRVSLFDSLDELSRHSLVLIEGDRVVCRHDLLGLSALSEVSQLSMRLLHRHAAETLEADAETEASDLQLWTAAEHWQAAGEHQRAVALLDRCATRAMDTGTPMEAARILEYALELVPEGPKHLDFYRRRVHALHTAREHAALVDFVDTYRTRASHADVDGASHSPEELFELDARLFAVGPSRIIATHCAECAANPDASPNHRVRAGIIGIKTAFLLCSNEIAESIRNGVADALLEASPALASEFRMIFQGSYGDVRASAAEARILLELQDGSAERANLVHLLHQCTIAFFIAGEVSEAEACLSRSAAIGKRLSLTTLDRSTEHQRAGYYLAAGRNSEAEEISVRLCTGTASPEGITMRTTQRNLARFAMMRGDYSGAKNWLGDFSSIWDGAYPREQHFIAEVRATYLMQSAGWIPDRSDMARLLRMYRSCRRSFNVDFFVRMILEAYERRREMEKAGRLAVSYLSRYRRERYPIIPILRAKLKELGVAEGGEIVHTSG